MTGLFVLFIYVGVFVASYFIVTKVVQQATAKDFTSLKTVTFGDESAVRPNRMAGILSILTIFLIWGMFTGSSPVSYTHLTLPTTSALCRSRWSPYH